GLRNLHDDVTKFRALEGGVLREEYRKRISTVAREERVDEILGLRANHANYKDDEIERIDEYVQQLSEERTPLTLHVLGEPMAAADRAPYLVSILGRNFLDRLGEVAKPPTGLTTDADRRAWLRGVGDRLIADVVIDRKPPSVRLTPDLEKDIE